uniref:THAP-type domain-containing protein n=1 Tax=Gadus morhua TaxID=8049 RepID=A0A8C5FC74_GADMO
FGKCHHLNCNCSCLFSYSLRFPKAGDQRRKWEVALKRQGFAANDDTMLCSKHFKPEHFDRTGQTVRIRLGVVPSIFAFPAHLLKLCLSLSLL